MPEQIVTFVCAGLVVIDEKSSVVSLVRKRLLSLNVQFLLQLMLHQITQHKSILKATEHPYFQMRRLT